MVGITNLELEAKLKKVIEDQGKLQEDSARRNMQIKASIEQLSAKTDESIKKLSDKTQETFDEIMNKSENTDNMLSEILKQLTRLSGPKPADEVASNNGFRPVGTIKPENIFATDKGKAKAKAGTTNHPPTNTVPPMNEPLVPKVSGEFPLPTHTEGRRNDTLSSTQIQFYNAPPSANNKKFLPDGTINLYQPVNAKTSGL
ncbi:hypothetical protein K3495_g16399, partial [Podosphaera aphanis]